MKVNKPAGKSAIPLSALRLGDCFMYPNSEDDDLYILLSTEFSTRLCIKGADEHRLVACLNTGRATAPRKDVAVIPIKAEAIIKE